MIHLVDVDPGNWRLGLKVSESQKNYVSDAYAMLASNIASIKLFERVGFSFVSREDELSNYVYELIH